MVCFEGSDSKCNDPFDLTRIVKIRVGQGDDAKEFFIHEGMLERSDFFRRALRGEWKEARARTIELPEDDAPVVEQYLRLIYVSTIALRKEPHPLELEESRQYCKNEMHKLSKLYVFAEKVQDQQSKNLALAAFINLVEHGLPHGKMAAPPHFAVRKIYEHTGAGDLARKFLVDFYACYVWSNLLDNGDAWPADFLLELSRALLDLSRPPRKALLNTPLAKKHEYKEEE